MSEFNLNLDTDYTPVFTMSEEQLALLYAGEEPVSEDDVEWQDIY